MTTRTDGKKIWIADRSFLVDGQKQPYMRNSKFERHDQ